MNMQTGYPMFSHHALEQLPAYTFYGEELPVNDNNNVGLGGDFEEENQMMQDENQENQG